MTSFDFYKEVTNFQQLKEFCDEHSLSHCDNIMSRKQLDGDLILKLKKGLDDLGCVDWSQLVDRLQDLKIEESTWFFNGEDLYGLNETHFQKHKVEVLHRAREFRCFSEMSAIEFREKIQNFSDLITLAKVNNGQLSELVLSKGQMENRVIQDISNLLDKNTSFSIIADQLGEMTNSSDYYIRERFGCMNYRAGEEKDFLKTKLKYADSMRDLAMRYADEFDEKSLSLEWNSVITELKSKRLDTLPEFSVKDCGYSGSFKLLCPISQISMVKTKASCTTTFPPPDDMSEILRSSDCILIFHDGVIVDYCSPPSHTGEYLCTQSLLYFEDFKWN